MNCAAYWVSQFVFISHTIASLNNLLPNKRIFSLELVQKSILADQSNNF